MKNQYVGDIGDYTKFGILRAIEDVGLTVGINWYLTPNDNRSDGNHTEYLKSKPDTPDMALHSILKEIVTADLRLVSELENRKLLKKAVYFNEALDFSNSMDRKSFRNLWHSRALHTLRSQDVIFLDPDNGLEVKSRNPYSINGNRFATYQEAAEYYQTDASIVVYNHRDRSPESKYIERFTRFKGIDITSSADIFCLKASRFSVRDYLFIAQKRHSQALRTVIDAMFNTGWSQYLSYRVL